MIFSIFAPSIIKLILKSNIGHVSMNEVAEKIDRRKRRTRNALRKALMELIVEKSFDAITVHDICDRADISRAAFYLHYKDKEDLLFSSMKDVYDDLVATSEALATNGQLALAIYNCDLDILCDPTDFAHVADHAEFYRVLLSEHGVASFTVKVRRYLADIIQQHILETIAASGQPLALPPGFIAHCMAGAQIGAFSWWLDEGMKHTPQEMAQMFYAMTAFGLQGALGVNFPRPTAVPG
jgi:AcrR family transcriptional regulator